MRQRDFDEPACRARRLRVMIAAPPTKTSANVPMNSATKWRQASRIGASVEVMERRWSVPLAASARFASTTAALMPPKPNELVSDVLDARRRARRRDVVEIAALVRDRRG